MPQIIKTSKIHVICNQLAVHARNIFNMTRGLAVLAAGRISTTALLFVCCNIAEAQTFQAKDSISALIKNSPSFTIYKDNYFITGVPVNTQPTKYNSDVKFQISFKQRLTNAVLPFNTVLYLSYTQKSFWDIYRKSSPFAETNYNPSIAISKFFYYKQKLISLSVAFEHESNGKDSIYSRSWNRLALNWAIEASKRSRLYLNFWIPFQYEADNPDLLDYVGKLEVAYQWKTLNQRLMIDATVRKGHKFDWRGSLQTQVSYRLNKNENQYITLQWFTGYAENLLDYKEKRQMLRLGITIKPSRFVFY
ncbi:phospholipase A [Mucilaginibacter sp. OK283]|uniref:phospholipase A n=1 Tax=Mucilaginibacter sp. OK283 TaxID=1881049 RepID=UPI0008C4BC3B|nr:phospholipase A [Mucilaginibacter sp. OK283]SEP40440.1 phospholipase A1 [Mucilaginibacter sp. OK283]